MQIGVLGINFKSAEISIREWVSKACQKQLSVLSERARTFSCVTLLTCNRAEIYFTADDLAEAHSDLLHLLQGEIPVAFEHALYSYFGGDCFAHLTRVASGLDSAIVAESEIQRQVKIAYERTMLSYSLAPCMHYLFQKALKLSKEIRSNFALSHSQVTLPKILFEISQKRMHNLKETPLLFIGNSAINRSVIAYFKRKEVGRMALLSRSPHLAAQVAEKEGLSLLPWEMLSAWQTFPLIICGSNAPHYIVTKSQETMGTRLIFDLSVPRNVDPLLAHHPDLTLLNMEELSCLLEVRQRKNGHAIQQAGSWIAENVQRHLSLFRQKEKRVFACA